MPAATRDPVKRPATYEDLKAVPDHKVAEIFDGELIVSPRPAVPHARAAGALLAETDNLYGGGGDGPGGWWILMEPELHLGADVLVPDIVGFRREKMRTLPRTAYFEVAPDWVCEVISPATARFDRVHKLSRYARYGVDFAWLVDPDSQTLEVYRRQGEHWLFIGAHEGNDPVRAPPFDAAPIRLARLWDLGEPAGTPPEASP
jgi:Uma2 family endonuclease